MSQISSPMLVRMHRLFLYPTLAKLFVFVALMASLPVDMIGPQLPPERRGGTSSSSSSSSTATSKPPATSDKDKDKNVAVSQYLTAELLISWYLILPFGLFEELHDRFACVQD